MRQEKIAVTLGLTPREFWAMTPREFNLVIRGRQQQWNREREVDAWKLSLLARVSGNIKRGAEHQVSPEALLRSCPGYVDHLKMEALFGD
jgi:hypothetical protein